MTEEKRGLWGKLRAGLARTHDRLVGSLALGRPAAAELDAAALAELEEALIGADLGVVATGELLDRLRERVRRAGGGDGSWRRLLAEEIAAEFAAAPAPPPTTGREITLVVGVNGAGKTTSIAKLARRDTIAGRPVLLAAADTFRAAAADQLRIWGDRLGVGVIRQAAGADPAAVVFDALQAARARAIDHLIVDTAGRLHTKEHLMAELAKIRRVIAREAPDWRLRTVLVLDATTGQNALAQAREFLKAASVDGVLLAKLDGTAKGGMAVAVARELKIPILHLGVGEGADDLVDFDPREFAAALVE